MSYQDPSQPPYGQPQYPQQADVTTPPSQPGYAQPQYPMSQPPSMPMAYAQPIAVPVALPPDPGSGQAVTSLVLSIIGLVFAAVGLFACGVTSIVGLVLGILGTIFGALGRKSVRRKGMATAGLVMGIISVALAIAAWVIVGAILSSAAAGAH